MKRVLVIGLLAVVATVGLLVWTLQPRVPSSAAARASEDAVPRATVAPEPPPLADEAAASAEDGAQREATPALDADEAQPAATSAALVRVRVVARESGEPIAGERLLLRPADTLEWTVQNVPGSHATLNESPLTDANGNAEFEVPAGKALFLDAVTRDSPLSHTAVAALEPGEVREVVLELEEEPELVCFVRVVDGETSVGLEGATLRFGGSRWNDRAWAAAANTRADSLRVHGGGLFELRARSWRLHGASAAAASYSRMWFPLQEGHASPATALEVRLQRAATLEVLVTDQGGASSGAIIEVTTDGQHVMQRAEGLLGQFRAGDPSWRVATDAAGAAEITTLPPDVPLTMKITAPGRAAYTDGKPIKLAPGERRRIEISLGSGATISGRVVDSAGQPLASIKVSRVVAQGTQPRLLQSHEPAVATTHSDDTGRFRFDDVAEGSWHVGPARECATSAAAELAGLAQVVTLAGAGDVHDIALTLDRGLYLAGSVSELDGTPALECRVRAHREDALLYESETTNDLGTFRIGPLPAGDYVVSAGGTRSPYAEGQAVRARAGESLVLQVTRGGQLSGNVVDESGQPAACRVSLTEERDGSSLIQTSTQDGSWQFQGLDAGAYRVIARAPDSRIGMSARLTLAAGATRDGVEVVLRTGATLELRYTGTEARAACRVSCDGSQVAWDGLERDKTLSIAVPAGTLELRWSDGKAEAESAMQNLTLAPGEKRDLAWDGKP